MQIIRHPDYPNFHVTLSSQAEIPQKLAGKYRATAWWEKGPWAACSDGDDPEELVERAWQRTHEVTR